MKIDDIVIKPILTEKATKMAADKIYSFMVAKSASKPMIKQAIEKIFSVKVDRIRVITRVGKVKKSGRKMVMKQLPNTKIAYVKVVTGKIDIFPQA